MKRALIGLVILVLQSTTGTAANWSIQNGWLIAQDGGSLFSTGSGYPLDVQVNDQWFAASNLPTRITETISGGGWKIRYTKNGVGRLEDIITPLGSFGWKRTLAYSNTSSATQDLTAAYFSYKPNLTPGGQHWLPRHFLLCESNNGKIAGVGFKGITDFYSYEYSPGGMVRINVQSAWRLGPGQTATVGETGVWVADGNAKTFRTLAQQWYQAAGMTITTPYPNWLREGILLETGAHGHIESRFSDVGGFQNFEKQVEYLADLGVSIIWYNAVHTHKSPPNANQGGWNHYDPLNFYQIDPILGGSSAFRALINKTKDCGIHPLCEIVLWGGTSIQARALPGSWVRDRAGNLLKPWSAPFVMDYSSLDWQAVMKQAVRLLADHGIEGVRIDVADGHGPNWGSSRTNQASYATMAGSLEILEALREGLVIDATGPVLIPESTVDRPEYLSKGITIGYGYETTDLLSRKIPANTQPVQMADQIRSFFINERGSLPEGALVLRTLNNHDTVADHGRVMQRYGSGLAKALYGICLVVPGIPMLYQEEEYGNYESLRQMNWGRRMVPEMAYGDADYQSVTFTPEVFCVLRSVGDSHALGMVNLSGQSQSNIIQFPNQNPAFASQLVYDAVSGITGTIENYRCPWTLKPYQTAILRIGKPPIGSPPPLLYPGMPPSRPVSSTPLRWQPDEGGIEFQSGTVLCKLTGGSSPWKRTQQQGDSQIFESNGNRLEVTPSEEGIRVNMALLASDPKVPELLIHNTDHWVVSGKTALLEDRLLRRHFPYPPGTSYYWNRSMVWGNGPWHDLYTGVFPNGRFWQSILEPLHPEEAGFIFTDSNQSGITISHLQTNARNVILTDRADEASQDPYGLAVRFLDIDTDLAPRVRAFGLGSIWEMNSYPELPLQPHSLSFVLSTADSPSAASMRDAERYPYESAQPCSYHQEGKATSFMFNALFFIDPALHTWCNLASVPGSYRIIFELRHSESSPSGTDLQSHYQVRLNGTLLPLEWFQLNTSQTGNAYFGYARTQPVDLSQKSNTVTIETTKTWCAVRGNFRLEKVGNASADSPGTLIQMR